MIKSHDQTRGPFRAAQLRSGEPYELDDGHPIECLPSGSDKGSLGVQRD